MNRRDREAARRLRRIRFRDGWTRDMWILLVALLVLAALFLTGTLTHPPHR